MSIISNRGSFTFSVCESWNLWRRGIYHATQSIGRAKDQSQEAVCKVYKQQLIVHYVGYEEERGADFLVKRDTILDRCWECHPTLP